MHMLQFYCAQVKTYSHVELQAQQWHKNMVVSASSACSVPAIEHYPMSDISRRPCSSVMACVRTRSVLVERTASGQADPLSKWWMVMLSLHRQSACVGRHAGCVR